MQGVQYKTAHGIVAPFASSTGSTSHSFSTGTFNGLNLNTNTNTNGINNSGDEEELVLNDDDDDEVIEIDEEGRIIRDGVVVEGCHVEENDAGSTEQAECLPIDSADIAKNTTSSNNAMKVNLSALLHSLQAMKQHKR